MVPPPLLCRAHLLGEHRELHALMGIIEKGTSLEGYVKKGLVETGLIWARHENLVHEMLARGYQHHSPMKMLYRPSLGRVDGRANVAELHRRCADCRERIDNATRSRRPRKNGRNYA